MVQEVYGMGDVYRRTLDGWQMFGRYSGQWSRSTATWEGLHLVSSGFVVLDVTAASRPEVTE